MVPIFAPPDGLSPAGMRYMSKMNADNRAFAAALVDMGVRGHIKLVEEDGGWSSRDKTRLERLDSATPFRRRNRRRSTASACPASRS